MGARDSSESFIIHEELKKEMSCQSAPFLSPNILYITSEPLNHYRLSHLYYYEVQHQKAYRQEGELHLSPPQLLVAGHLKRPEQTPLNEMVEGVWKWHRLLDLHQGKPIYLLLYVPPLLPLVTVHDSQVQTHLPRILGYWPLLS